MEEVRKKKGNTGLIVLIMFLFIVILGLVGFGYYDYQEFNKKYDALSDKYDQLNSNYEKIKGDYDKTKDELDKSKKEAEQTVSTKEEFFYKPYSSNLIDVNGYGKVQVLGYAYTEKKFLGGKDTYVFFKVLQSSGNNFSVYLNNHDGNSFVKKNAIGLGCIVNGKIGYYNASDEFGDKDFDISGDDTSKILNSSKAKPIKLNLEKLKFSSGAGSDSYCYSHMTYINIAK